MRKLFVSFTSLLSLVRDGVISEQDLDQGLFFFGCWREHALNPGANGESDQRTWYNGRYADAHPVIVKALLKAEAEGRVAWHRGPGKSDNPWHTLDGLLAASDLPVLQVVPDIGSHYSYPGIRDAVQEKGLNLEVVF